MGQCGCATFGVEKGFNLPDGTELTYLIYHGCPECFPGIAVDVSLFAPGNEWTEGYELKKITPDEYGGHYEDPNQQLGIPIPLFEVRDLVEAAREIGGTNCSIFQDGQVSIEEWLEENGLQMLRKALDLFEKRMKDMHF